MGILNVTPDSFSDGGKFTKPDKAVWQARRMVRGGADIIDIGGESTRPGARTVGEEEERSRVLPVVEALGKAGLKAEISIDTRRSGVAAACMAAGASIWNDVTALGFEKNSPCVAARLGCKVVLMHMQGRPLTMQDKPEYGDVFGEVGAYLKCRADTAIKAGVEPGNIWLDPGIGFGKRHRDNLDLLARLDDFHKFGFPLLVGTSRKSFIRRISDSDVSERLGGSLASALWSVALGADILRVHDIQETVQAVKVWRALSDR